MGGGGVDDAGAIVVDQRHALTRRIVGQAQDHEIGIVQRRAPRRGILAQIAVERDEIDLGAPGQPFADFQAGGAGSAVDEDRTPHGSRLRTTMAPASISAIASRTTCSDPT